MEEYVFLGLHLKEAFTTAAMWDTFSKDRYGENVNLMVSGVDSNLPVKVSTTLTGITKAVDICLCMI